MIRKITTAILRDLGFDFFDVSYTLTEDRHMRELNREYRKTDKTTDVLSFPQYRFFRGELLEPVIVTDRKIPLGDIVISVETIKRRSRGKREYTDYLFRTIIHGILHLLGFDHKTITERKIMRENEKTLYNIYRKDFRI